MNNLKEPLISIIVPIYNGEKFLEETIKSICESQYKNIEILCIDDCSKDKSVEICQKLKNKDARIKVFVRAENGGVAQARNTGLHICNGQYICFADQDDIVAPEFYATLIDDLVRNNCQVAISNISHMIDGVLQNHKTIKNSCVVEGEERKHLLKWLVLDKSDSSIPSNTVSKTVWNCMFDAELIRKNNITFKRIVAYEDDWLFLLENIRFATRVFLEDRALYTWRIHKTQATQSNRYIENYAEKRIMLRQYVFLQIKNIYCTDKEIQDYNEEYVARLVSEGLINEVNIKGKWDAAQLKKAKLNLTKLWNSLHLYMTKTLLKKIRLKIWKSNSFYNALPKILVTYELYLLAIGAQTIRNVAICKAKKFIKR